MRSIEGQGVAPSVRKLSPEEEEQHRYKLDLERALAMFVYYKKNPHADLSSEDARNKVMMYWIEGRYPAFFNKWFDGHVHQVGDPNYTHERIDFENKSDWEKLENILEDIKHIQTNSLY